MKNKYLILLIDDDKALGKTIQNLLLANNFDVCYCDNGATGIQKTFELNPDLILCDIQMNPIDGYHVFSVLNESNYINNAPFIFMSGKSDLDDIRLGLDLGVDDYIVKPFNNENLIQIIHKRIAKVERLLKLGQNEFETLMRVSPYGIVVFDDSFIYNVNDAFAQSVNIPLSNIKSRNFNDFIDPKYRQIVEHDIFRALNKVSPCKKYSLKLINDKRKYILHTSLTRKYKGYVLMIGILIPENENTDLTNLSRYNDIITILKDEDVNVDSKLSEKLKLVFGRVDEDKKSVTPDRQFKLSKRESEVLNLSCKGLPIKQIAQELFISERTVEKHRASLMGKTETVNIVELMIYAIKNQLVEI